MLVITDWTSITRDQLKELLAADDPAVLFSALKPRFTTLIKGLSWPATERLTYRVDEEVRWHAVNLSSQQHPMHLHGFYYSVDSLGDGLRDIAFDEAPTNDGHEDHAMAGMAGMAMGITVVRGEQPAAEILVTRASLPTRALTLVMQTEPKRFGAAPAYGFVLVEANGAITSDKVPVPGPTLTLKRGEPVEITLVNRLPEATAIHWHGMELESYYDGVHGWSGAGSRVTPLIPPGESFVVRFTPPRAGTFIYHTHMHDDHQLPSGMYGALLVLEPDEIFDPAFDHVLVIAQDGPGAGGPGQNLPIIVNGTREPVFVWKAGAPHRLRLINITASDVTVVSMATPAGPLTWKPVGKDGADVPPAQRDPRPAVQTIAAGETFDFEYEAPRGRQAFWVEFRTPAGRWQAQGRVTIK